jgi:hypothetical protein
MIWLSNFLCLLQWFAITRRHALLILADNLYYNKFKLYCKVCSHRIRVFQLNVTGHKLRLPNNMLIFF